MLSCFSLFVFQLEEQMVAKGTLNLPNADASKGDTIFEYVVNEKGEWEHWDNRVPQYVYPTDSTPEYSSILVPNTDNVRTDFLINAIARQEKAVLLIGKLYNTVPQFVYAIHLRLKYESILVPKN